MLNSSPNLNLSLISLYNHVCPHARQCRNIHTTMVSDSESYWIWSYRKFHTHVFTLILDSNTLSRHKDTQAHFILCKISSWIFVRARLPGATCALGVKCSFVESCGRLVWDTQAGLCLPPRPCWKLKETVFAVGILRFCNLPQEIGLAQSIKSNI